MRTNVFVALTGLTLLIGCGAPVVAKKDFAGSPDTREQIRRALLRAGITDQFTSVVDHGEYFAVELQQKPVVGSVSGEPGTVIPPASTRWVYKDGRVVEPGVTAKR